MPKLFTQTFDLLYISYRFIMNNRKALFATLLGLVIATTVMATSSMLIDSYNSDLIDEFLYPDERNEFSGEIQIEIGPTFLTGELEWFSNYDNFTQLVNNSFIEAESLDYLDKQTWFGEFYIGFWDSFPLNNSYFRQAFLRSLEEDLLTTIEPLLNPGGRLPSNYTEIIMVRFDNETQFEVGQKFAVGLAPWTNRLNRDTAVNTTIVGVLDYYKVEELILEKYYLQSTPIIRQDTWYGGAPVFMLTSLNKSLELMTPIMDGNFEAISTVFGKVFIDQSAYDVHRISSEKDRMNSLFLRLNENFVALENNSLTIDIVDIYLLLDTFDDVAESVQILQVLLLLIDIPIIAISIYLVSYSYSLIKRQKKETIGILKTRGSTWQQVVFFLVGESAVVVAVTLISGSILGYVVSGTILKSVNFLDFSGKEIPVLVSPGLLQLLLIFVVLITILLNLSAIVQYTRMTIQESIIPVVGYSSFWKRYYLDIIATLLGLGGYYLINELGETIGSAGDSNPLLPIIFLIVGVPTPFFLFFGTILLIARLFPIFIDKIAQILWKRRGKLGAFALRNVVRHREAASQAVILITLAISYTIISGSLAISVDETAKMGYYHHTGADLKVNIVGPYGDGVVLNAVKNVTGVSSVSQTFLANSPSETGTSYYVFFFVDPDSYAETAFFDEERFGITSPLSTLMESISDNKSIILSQKNMDSNPSLDINDTFGYHFYNESLYYRDATDYRNFTIVGTFNQWPQYQEYSWAPDDSIFAVGSLGLFESLHQHEYLGIYDTSILAKLEPNSNTEEIYETVKYLSEQTQHTYSAKLDYENYIESAERRFILAVLNTALTACILISVLGSVMFSVFTYLERGKEIGVERALGMTRTQTAKLFTMEGLTILLFGLIIGVGVGMTNTSIFLLVIQMGRTIPPIVVDYPLGFITNFLILVIVIAAVGTVVIAYQSTKKDISRVLKVE